MTVTIPLVEVQNHIGPPPSISAYVNEPTWNEIKNAIVKGHKGHDDQARCIELLAAVCTFGVGLITCFYHESILAYLSKTDINNDLARIGEYYHQNKNVFATDGKNIIFRINLLTPKVAPTPIPTPVPIQGFVAPVYGGGPSNVIVTGGNGQNQPQTVQFTNTGYGQHVSATRSDGTRVEVSVFYSVLLLILD